MSESWTARKMVPGKDTISVMAMHYGFKPSVVRDVIRAAGVKVIREDGFKGYLHMKTVSGSSVGKPGVRRTKVITWSDGSLGVDPATTKLTKEAIKAVAFWAFNKSNETSSDN
ncbi:MAG TPA: hypothetical protein VIY48_11675 [Candidatus Paceibacterota bacterium]